MMAGGRIHGKERSAMLQQGQVLRLKSKGLNDEALWAYRYRVGGRDSKRVQRGGFRTERDAREALERELEVLRRVDGLGNSLTLAELVDEYLAQHDADTVTIDKLRWLLAKATAAFGDRRLSELRPHEIAAWRMTIPPGHRFEATQALRQVLARAVVWQMLIDNPALVGVDNPTRRRKEQRPFESWEELEALAGTLGPYYGPMVVFAAATGLRPGEWVALEHRDVDRDARVAYVRRAFTNGRLKHTKTEASVRAVPLQAIALAAVEELPSDSETRLLFPSPRGGYLDLRNFRNRHWKPAQLEAGIEPVRRMYDLRHTFATFALRAGISTFELSRYMGTSLLMIDRHYGHLARDGREHAIRLLDSSIDVDVHRVDARWTSRRLPVAQPERENATSAGEKLEARSRTRTDDPFLTMEVLYRLSYPGGQRGL
jgi:integrase